MMEKDMLKSPMINLPVIMLATSVGAMIVLGVVLKIRESRKRRYKYPPCLPSVPFFGSLPFMPNITQSVQQFFLEKSKTLGSSVFTFYAGSRLLVVLNDKQAIQEALIRRAQDFSDRYNQYVMREIFNRNQNGIIQSKYNANFKKIHQVTLSILKGFGLGQKEMEERIIREVEELLQYIREAKGKPFCPAPFISLCTMNVVASILFGKRIGQMDPKLEKLSNDVQNFIIEEKKMYLNYCPPLRFIPPFRDVIPTLDKYDRGAFSFIDDNIRKCLTGEEKGGEEGDDGRERSFVKTFVEKLGPDYNRKDLRYICRDLLDAGSETSSSTIQWAVGLLANNPEIQERLRNEIDSVVPHEERLPSVDDMGKMPYVEAAILELMRIKTIVPLSLPHETNCDTQVAGYYIPKGTMVLPNLHAVHMDPDVWGDPETFRPERFLDDSGKTIINKNSIIPFSMGRRSCLGENLARQEIFLLFTSLLQQFEIRPPDGQEMIEMKERGSVTKSPVPFPVRMILRKN